MTKRGMRITCWIPKATNTHSEYVILIAFHYNSGCGNGPQCYIIRTLPVLFIRNDVIARIDGRYSRIDFGAWMPTFTVKETNDRTHRACVVRRGSLFYRCTYYDNFIAQNVYIRRDIP